MVESNSSPVSSPCKSALFCSSSSASEMSESSSSTPMLFLSLLDVDAKISRGGPSISSRCRRSIPNSLGYMTTLRIRPSAGTNEFATAMMSVARMLSQSMFTAAKRAEMSPVGTSLSSPASSVCSSSSTSSSSSLELSSDEDSSPPSLMGSKPSCCTLCISFLTALSRFLLAGRSSSSSSPSSSSSSSSSSLSSLSASYSLSMAFLPASLDTFLPYLSTVALL